MKIDLEPIVEEQPKQKTTTLKGVHEFLKDKKKIMLLIGGKDEFTDGIPAEIFESATNPEVFVSWISDQKVRSPDADHKLAAELSETGKLLRCYTRNVDLVELRAGVPMDRIVATRGNFIHARCSKCGTVPNMGRIASQWSQQIVSKCKNCECVIRPNLIMNDEPISTSFRDAFTQDIKEVDCVLVMGFDFHPKDVYFNRILLEIPNAVPFVFVDAEEDKISKFWKDDATQLKTRAEEYEKVLANLKERIKLLEAPLDHLVLSNNYRDFANALLRVL